MAEKMNGITTPQKIYPDIHDPPETTSLFEDQDYLVRNGGNNGLQLPIDDATAPPAYVPKKFDFGDKISENSVEEIKQKDGNERGSWVGRFDCLMSLIAYAVGLGNVWRFPYLCYKNGGGAFLFPYLICWVLAGVPIFFLEVSIGQYLQLGGLSVWKLCPILKGVGIANVVISCFCNIYYCVIVCWAMFYMVSSFRAIFPWEGCKNPWNDDTCEEVDGSFLRNTSFLDNTTMSLFAGNDTMSSLEENVTDGQTAIEQFWFNRVLKSTNDIGDFGGIQWELLGLLLLAWLIVYFALWKGITKARKFVYFCACSPYFLLVILLLRGLTLRGAGLGIKYYLMPQPERLLDPTVWKDAGTQVFYSYGIGFGTLVALGSYNKYHHNVHRDALTLCCVNLCTSLTAGFVVFSVLGFMATNTGKTVADVVQSGVGLAFLVYPEVTMALPLKQLWSVLFFLMICILGIDSQVCTVEGVITALTDQFPKLLQRRKELFVAILCLTNFLAGIPMVSYSGQYWLTLLDAYGPSGIAMLWIVFFEVVGLAWGFGAKQMYKGLDDMIGFKPGPYWRICWQYTAPAICALLFFIVVTNFKPLFYADKRPYPEWSQILGLLISACSILAIPGYAIYYLATCKAPTFREKFRKGITPKITLDEEEDEEENGTDFRGSSRRMEDIKFKEEVCEI